MFSLDAESGNVQVGSHEFLHHVLDEIFKRNPEVMMAISNALDSYLKSLDPRQVRDADFRQRLISYQRLPADQRAEETITVFSDALATGAFQYNETIFTKIGDMIRRILQNYLGVPIVFGNGRAIFNFIKDYNKSFGKGEMSTAIQKAMDRGVSTGRDVKVKNIKKKYENEYQNKSNKINARDDISSEEKARLLEELKKDINTREQAELMPIEDEFAFGKKGIVRGNIRENIKTVREDIAKLATMKGKEGKPLFDIWPADLNEASLRYDFRVAASDKSIPKETISPLSATKSW